MGKKSLESRDWSHWTTLDYIVKVVDRDDRHIGYTNIAPLSAEAIETKVWPN